MVDVFTGMAHSRRVQEIPCGRRVTLQGHSRPEIVCKLPCQDLGNQFSCIIGNSKTNQVKPLIPSDSFASASHFIFFQPMQVQSRSQKACGLDLFMTTIVAGTWEAALDSGRPNSPDSYRKPPTVHRPCRVCAFRLKGDMVHSERYGCRQTRQ
jgi:hypothetical protein